MRTRWLPTVVGCAVLLAGCSAPEPSGDASPPPTAPEALEEPEGPEEPEAAEEPEPCDPADLAAIDAVIAAQLDAFAADDWAAALALASDDFRAGTDPDTFATMIEERFPVIADGAQHRSEACSVSAPGAAEVRVVVTAAGGERADLVYLVVDESGWAIAGAVPLATEAPDVTDV